MSEYEDCIADAWANLPRDAKLRMWSDEGLSDLYWACARLCARREAAAFVAETMRKLR
jgi:hypothetical protein